MVVKKVDGNEEIELNSSVLDCLRHACKSHWNVAEGTLMSPARLSQQHDISPRQYQKVALEVRTSAGEWDDVDKLLLTKVTHETPYLMFKYRNRTNLCQFVIARVG